MYKNYGDQNFFNRGILVEENHDNGEFDVLYCMPLDDEEGYYIFGDCIVDINDSWIDRNAVCSFIGMDESNIDEVLYAIGCIDYYGIDNFSSQYAYDQHHVSREEICNILKYRDISPDGINIEW